MTSFTRQLLTYEFVKVKGIIAMQWLHVNLDRRNYHSLFYIKRRLASDDKKVQVNVLELATKVHKQQQMIRALESRLTSLETNLEFLRDKCAVMDGQMVAILNIWRTLTRPGVNLGSYY